MGAKGREIVSGDVDVIINLLNKAFADEWLAFYQYWIGAYIAQGALRGALVPQFFEHAQEELKHAERLAKRILQLGGTPPVSPQGWLNMSNCAYGEPKNRHVRALLEQNIISERCAIVVYKKLCDATKASDIITYNLVTSILKDEVEHEDELQAFQEDFTIGMAE